MDTRKTNILHTELQDSCFIYPTPHDTFASFLYLMSLISLLEPLKNGSIMHGTYLQCRFQFLNLAVPHLHLLIELSLDFCLYEYPGCPCSSSKCCSVTANTSSLSFLYGSIDQSPKSLVAVTPNWAWKIFSTVSSIEPHLHMCFHLCAKLFEGHLLVIRQMALYFPMPMILSWCNVTQVYKHHELCCFKFL